MVARTIDIVAVAAAAAAAVDSALLAWRDYDSSHVHRPVVFRSKISQRFSGTLLAKGLKPCVFWMDQNTYTFVAAAAAYLRIDLDFWHQSTRTRGWHYY